MMALNKLFKTLGYAYKPLLKKLGVSLPIISLEGLLQRADIVLSNLKDVSTIFRADILSSGLTFLVILVFLINFIGTIYVYVLALNVICFFIYLEGFISFKFQRYQNLCMFIVTVTFSFMFSNLVLGNHLLNDSLIDSNNEEIKEMGFCKTPSSISENLFQFRL